MHLIPHTLYCCWISLGLLLGERKGRREVRGRKGRKEGRAPPPPYARAPPVGGGWHLRGLGAVERGKDLPLPKGWSGSATDKKWLKAFPDSEFSKGGFIGGRWGDRPLEIWGEILKLELYFCFECRLNLVFM